MSTGVAISACAICNKPVSLETAKADEDGRTVHEQCYVLKLKGEQGAPESKGRQSPKASDAIRRSDV